MNNSTVIKQSRPKHQHAANITVLCFKNILVNNELKMMKFSQTTSFLAQIHPSFLAIEHKIIYIRDRQAPERMELLSLVPEDENWSILACLVKCISLLSRNVRMRLTSKDQKSTQLLPNTRFGHLGFRCFWVPISYKALSCFFNVFSAVIC